jgi:hypothetical protein
LLIKHKIRTFHVYSVPHATIAVQLCAAGSTSG